MQNLVKRPAQRKFLKEVITEAEVANSRSLFFEKYLGQETPETVPLGFLYFLSTLNCVYRMSEIL